MSSTHDNELSWILNHLGEDRENYYQAVNAPIVLSSNFCFRSVSEMRTKLERELETPFYTRGYNPTVGILRKKIAALEKTEDAIVFASGSAAIAAAVMSVVKGGDHVVCVQKPYSWTNTLISSYLAKYGVESTFVDGRNEQDIFAAVKPNTKLIYLESPNSLTFELQNITAITNFAKTKKITTIIDNSYCSPLNQSPAEMGVDIVVHSATKYLNGHSDVVAGIVASTKAHCDKMMAEEYMTIGGIIGAHDAWLMIRGLRTLELRVNRSSSSGQHIAEWLEQHPTVERVIYPTLKSNPQYDLAKKQMKQGGGLLSVILKAKDVAAVETFCDSLQYFLIATSWGGHESLVLPICALKASASLSSQLPWNMVRLYIGLEDPELLKADLAQSLKHISA
ncbi:MAG TPA: aminotransferase class I/II-fold pyridoxal phosphate-dependent enzyme [Bacteroidia bacterium]|nr:aminotransferase class I/II-fold pyridoxal phosphate-dependent enzyme [Bacteroidia bacterium]